MKSKIIVLALTALFAISTASAQMSPDLEDRLSQKPDTSKVDVIILTQPNGNEQAKSAVRNSKGNVTHDFDIVDGVAVTIPRVAADNLADRDFVREIQPDYSVETKLSDSTGTVRADEVWSQNASGSGVDVAVLDTGIEDNTILDVEDQVDYTGEGTDDLNGHGTHVAGIIASPDDEYRGLAYGADLFDVKVLDKEGSGSASDVIEGLEWAVDNNADIATLSLGAAVDQCDGTSSLSEAVDNTVEKGVTVTVAAGNQGPDSETITAPGCAQKPITVGSSGNGEISDFSSRGPTADGRVKPDLVAPGEGITSLTKNDGDSPQFETLSGTSMATPHVAGATALLMAEENLTPKEVKNITTYTAEDLGADENSQGAGSLDAYAAFQEVAQEEKNQTENDTDNETENQPPVVEGLEEQVNLLNTSAEAELAINATDEDDSSLNATFYLGGQQINKQEGYGEITYTATDLNINTTYNWSAEVTDGMNTRITGTQSFSTDVESENETEEDENRTENRRRPDLPPQASDTAKKATAGFFNPTSPFYGFDLAFDRVSVAIGLKTKEDVMEERASEARAMIERGNEKAAEKAVENLRETAGNGENATEKAEQILERVMKSAPEESKKGLRKAFNNKEKERGEKQGKPGGAGQSKGGPEQDRNERGIPGDKANEPGREPIPGGNSDNPSERGNPTEETEKPGKGSQGDREKSGGSESDTTQGRENSNGDQRENKGGNHNEDTNSGSKDESGAEGSVEAGAGAETEGGNAEAEVGANTDLETETGGSESQADGEMSSGTESDSKSSNSGDKGGKDSGESGQKDNSGSEDSNGGQNSKDNSRGTGR